MKYPVLATTNAFEHRGWASRIAGWIFFSITLWITLPIPLSAQVDTAWVRRYNGPGNAGDYAHNIFVDDSGYVYVTGGSWGIGTCYDYATIKYDPDGDTVWVRRYNGTGNDSDEGDVVVVDDSGNVYVTGYSYGSSTNSDCATIKYFPNGDTAWTRRYDGCANVYNYIARSLALDNSGNVYVACESETYSTSTDYATIKYYPNGDTAWTRRYNGTYNGADVPCALAIDDSGNVYVTGGSQGSGTNLDYATIKYDPNGDTIWVRRYNGAGNDYDRAYALVLDNAGNVYVTGGSQGFGTSLDYTTIKYYANGDTAWVRSYDGPANGWDWANAMAIDSSGNVYVTGESQGLNGTADYATVKYYSNGDTAWSRRYNGPGNDFDRAYAVEVDSAGNVYVTGGSKGWGTDLDYATIKYYPNGDPAWCMRYNGPANAWDDARNMTLDNLGNVYVTGHGEGMWQDYATIKYVQTTGINEDSAYSVKQSAFYTTIFSGPLLLPKGKKCKVFDITGRVVMPDKIKPGIYFIEVDGILTKKVVKVR
jgi:uncharacterized delta-60 repeat protein